MPTLRAEYNYIRKKELKDPAAVEKLQEQAFLYNSITLKGLCNALRNHGYDELADNIKEKGEALNKAVEPTPGNLGGASLARWKETRSEAAELMDLLEDNKDIISGAYALNPGRVKELFDKTTVLLEKADLSTTPKLPAYEAPSKKNKYGLSKGELADAFEKYVWIGRLTDEVIMSIDTNDPDQVRNCIDQYRLCKTALHIVEETKDLPDSEKTPEKFIGRLERGLKDPWIQNDLKLEYTPECCDKCLKDSVKLNNHFYMVEVREMLKKQDEMEKASAEKQETAEYSSGESDEYEGSEYEDEMDETDEMDAETDEPENEKTIVPPDQLTAGSELSDGVSDTGADDVIDEETASKQQTNEAADISNHITGRKTVSAFSSRPKLPEELNVKENEIKRGSSLKELSESEDIRLHELYKSTEDLKEGLEAKHITGLFSGSTGAHQKMLDAFIDMQNSVSGSQGDSLSDEERQKRLEALVKAKKAAEDYITEKKAHGWGNTGSSDWRPLTRMGKRRYEAALAIIEAVDRELEAEANAVELHDKLGAAENDSMGENGRRSESADNIITETETSNDEKLEDNTSELLSTEPATQQTADDPSKAPANLDPAYYADSFYGATEYLEDPENRWEDVRDYVTFHAAAVIVTKDLELMQKKTGAPLPDISQAEFNANIKEFMKTEGFRETINEYGGTGWNALKNISGSIEKDGGKELHSKYVKNGISAKKQAEKNAEIKEDYMNKEKVKEKTIKHDRVMGQ